MLPPRQDLLERLQELPESSQRHVFFILKRKGIKYTENGNGVFFNLTTCQDPEVWEALQRIVEQQVNMQRENQERETRLREMQELLRRPESPAPAPAPSAAVPQPVPVPDEQPQKKRARNKPAPRDILSMLAK